MLPSSGTIRETIVVLQCLPLPEWLVVVSPWPPQAVCLVLIMGLAGSPHHLLRTVMDRCCYSLRVISAAVSAGKFRASDIPAARIREATVGGAWGGPEEAIPGGGREARSGACGEVD